MDVGGAGAEKPSDELLFVRRLVAELLLDAFVNGLPQTRNADHVVRLMVFKVFFDVANIGVELGAAARKNEVLKGPFIGVPNRQNTHHPIALIHQQHARCHIHLIHQITMGQHDALGHSGGSGGVHQRGEAVRGKPMGNKYGISRKGQNV